MHSENFELRQSATVALWNYWYLEAGKAAELEMREGVKLLDHKKFIEARSHFETIINMYPKYPEAYNKLATVLFLLEEYEQSLKECKVTLSMNPHHFGAWHGMGLCLFQLARYDEAISSFKAALEIQPYAHINRKYIARCIGSLN